MEQHLAIRVAPDKADRQAAPKLAAFCLIANAAVETRAQHVKLGFAHRAFETEQKPIVEERGMIDAVGIANERVGQAGEVDETMPIGIIAGEPRDLEAEHKTHPCERHFGGEVGKARSRHRARTGEAEIFVNDNDPILRPAELTGLARERILPFGRFAIVLDLSGAGLTQIDDSLARQVARGDLAALIHRASPSLLPRRAFGRRAGREARLPPSAWPRRFAAMAWSGDLSVSGSLADPSDPEWQSAVASLLPSCGADSAGRLRRALMIARRWSNSSSLPRSREKCESVVVPAGISADCSLFQSVQATGMSERVPFGKTTRTRRTPRRRMLVITASEWPSNGCRSRVTTTDLGRSWRWVVCRIFLRFGQLGMAGPFRRASDQGLADDPPDPEMA